MHKIFGQKEHETYTDRTGAYLIPIQDNTISVIQTSKGYFLIGGGKEENETDEDCIYRECLEETGCEAIIKEKICCAEAYTTHPVIGYFHPVQTYYTGTITEKRKEPAEQDHQFLWIPYELLKGNLYSDMQNWALQQAWIKHQHIT